MTTTTELREGNCLAIDPGFVMSGFVVFDGQQIGQFGKWKNDELLQAIVARSLPVDRCVIEMIGHYGSGMSVGTEVFCTCVYIGRVVQAWLAQYGVLPELILRTTIRAHMCRDMRAKDANVRQALIDRWGGSAATAKAQKCETCKGKGYTGRDHAVCTECNGAKITAPAGPLYKFAADAWQALALAVSWHEGAKLLEIW